MKMCFRSIVPAIRPRLGETALKREFHIYMGMLYTRSLGNQRSIDFPFVSCHFFPSPSLFRVALRGNCNVVPFDIQRVIVIRLIRASRFSPYLCLSLSVDPGGGSLLISVERPQDSFRARNKAFTRSRCVTRLMKSYPSSPPQLTVARGGATKRARFNQPTFASINCNRLFFA